MARYRKLFAIAALVISTILGIHTGVFAKGSVVNSPHNLSVTGGLGAHGISFNEIRICVFCHTPHNAVNTNSTAPLWNRALPPEGQLYFMYQSDYFTANVGGGSSVPTGASRVCLSCHDGTLALNSYGGPVLGDTQGSSAPTFMPGDINPSKNSNLTTDLSDDHPISFPYTDDLAMRTNLVLPETLPKSVKLDSRSNVQCTACHDPHDNQYGNFLVMNNGDATKPDFNPTVTSPLCVTCHVPPGWDSSSPHYAGAGCLNCHMTHTATVKSYLLNAPVDQVCYNGTGCHGSTLPPTHLAKTLAKALQKKKANAADEAEANPLNLETVFRQSLYKHPVGLKSGQPYKVNERLPLRQPRVECVDCHNAHVAGSSTQKGGSIKKSLKMVKGLSKSTMVPVDASYEYEICYKCHSGPFAFRFVGVTKPNRMIPETDQRKRFDGINPSFHPVAVTRRGTGRSLLSEYQSTMLTIECSDCHNSDQSKKAGGVGPNGPHGSRYEHILIARYEMPRNGELGQRTSCSNYLSDYALCFTCHSESYLMTSVSSVNGTAFRNGSQNEHAVHVMDNCIPCFACHDPHGVPTQDGASRTNNAFLINFDKTYAASAAVPMPKFTARDGGGGTCYVSCHASGTGKSYYTVRLQ